MLTLRHISSVYSIDEVCTEKGYKVYILGEKSKQHTYPRVEHTELSRHPKLKGLIISYSDNNFILSVRQNDSSIISYCHGEINELYKPTFHPVLHCNEVPMKKECHDLVKNFYDTYISSSIEYISRGHAIARETSHIWPDINLKLIDKITNSINKYLKMLNTENRPRKLYEIRCKLGTLIILDMKYIDIIKKISRIENEVLDISRLVSDVE